MPCLHVHFVFTEVMVHFERVKFTLFNRPPYNIRIHRIMCKRQTKYKIKKKNQPRKILYHRKFFVFGVWNWNRKHDGQGWLYLHIGQIACDARLNLLWYTNLRKMPPLFHFVSTNSYPNTKNIIKELLVILRSFIGIRFVNMYLLTVFFDIWHS